MDDDDDCSVFFRNDCASILSQIKDQDEQIRLKRRRLLGCDMSESKDHTPGKTEFVPESLLRGDDIFYETIKSRVEEAFGICKNEQVCNDVQQKELKFSSLEVARKLDFMTNKGLYLIAIILTGGSTVFDKTRWKMKEIIKDSISRDFGKGKDDTGKQDIVNQLHQVLSDPANFREDCSMNLARTSTLQSHRDAAMKVLNELDSLSTHTLRAMKRKLKGSRMIPQLKTSRFGQSRSDLISQVKQTIEKMLSELSAGDKLQERLAKALSLVDLSLKLSPGYKTTAATDFFRFSPETKNLQNEIVKAVWLLRKVRFPELKRLHLCLDPEAEVSKDSLRSAVRQMLIEYLFECSDMDTIPKSLMEALSLVNRRTRNVEHKVFPREAIEEETECTLNVSAQVKQIFCQCIPNYELDEDFDDAYMEDLEDSDDDDDFESCSLFDNESRCRNIKLEVKGTQEDSMGSSDSDHEESGAECLVLDPTDSTHVTNQHSSVNRIVIRDLTESITRDHPRSLYVTPTSNKSTLMSDKHDIGTSNIRVKVERDIEMEGDNQFSSRSLFSVENIKSDDHGEQKPRRRNKNQYLAVQDISDETSLVAHDLIGRLLEKFADRQGLDLEADERSYLGGESRLQEGIEGSEIKQASLQEKSDESIIVSATKELMPSLEESVFMKLKELMNVS
ncbi:PREDICTED: uncharacterized protein LOC104724413 [Camelina sativa]|uniref:Uncharacterized protein LOC104724413 n=1 Tax=Camelina sativa TaxID=90675 RepID=A0ABM0UHF1_CAMSA|nr:PREDICTED: uncharacterized protein LOC104724413 [Camelina sativa]